MSQNGSSLLSVVSSGSWARVCKMASLIGTSAKTVGQAGLAGPLKHLSGRVAGLPHTAAWGSKTVKQKLPDPKGLGPSIDSITSSAFSW